ncbi:NYN domain-containing protein [Massilia terrae]
MAVFCDFENVALGVRDANYEKFDIRPVLERLLLKGSIVVKKSYCDWERYKGFKAGMHEANFELIEIPHVRQSGKNSADIRLVVDALDLCYTKSHVNTFVIISGDSDFSPLVSKLRENAKKVIGVGVKQSTSDLLVANCDEFIFYDDLVREKQRAAAKRDERKAQPQAKRPSDDRRKEELEARRLQALEMVVETFDALTSERGDTGKIWASLLKDTLKRRRPDFSETYYGFRTFGNLLEEAQARGLFEFGRDEKSGTYVYRSSTAQAPSEQIPAEQAPALAEQAEPAVEAGEQAEAQPEAKESRRRGRGGRKQREQALPVVQEEVMAEPVVEAQPEPVAEEPLAEAEGLSERIEASAAASEEAAAAPKGGRRAPRKTAARKAPAVEVPAEIQAVQAEAALMMAPGDLDESADGTAEAGDGATPARKKSARAAHKAPVRKSAPRSRRPAKPKTPPESA